ncbi:unnamed protein product [Aureobasidium vineae]|uniref:F-box domain-containing protein n=1 Tax=Aureobasidium vineae TaxID=2773715 RepID=A0A9N8P4Q9_9PEZI|nr:unnamed protein product [Aureobasidium vineae]
MKKPKDTVSNASARKKIRAVFEIIKNLDIRGVPKLTKTKKILYYHRSSRELLESMRKKPEDPKQFLDLPNEILLMIVAAADKEDLTNLRLVCRRLLEVVETRFADAFFSHRIHVASMHSMEGLLNIVKHPWFSHHVKRIIISTLSTDSSCNFIGEELRNPIMEEAFNGIKGHGHVIDVAFCTDNESPKRSEALDLENMSAETEPSSKTL